MNDMQNKSSSAQSGWVRLGKTGFERVRCDAALRPGDFAALRFSALDAGQSRQVTVMFGGKAETLPFALIKASKIKVNQGGSS